MTGPTADFWRGRRVLVTGHTGFKGSWLCLWLRHWGARVVGLAIDPPTEPSLFELAGVEAGLETSVHADVRDLGAVRRVVRDSGAEIVIHMAAQSLVRESYDDPVGTYSTNIMGTVHLLDAVRGTESVRTVLVVTSDKCYENREWVWGYRENDPLGGHDPYSSSKGCAELVTSAYRRSFLREQGLGVASARAGNVIGGGDWAVDRLIPDLVRGAIAGEPVEIRNPAATRPWQHVLEPLSGYLAVAEALTRHPEEFSGGWNFGPGIEDAQPVRRVADDFVALWGEGADWETDATEHPHEAGFLHLDWSKASSLLGWRPRWPLGEGLRRTVQWYRRYAAAADADALRAHALADIEAYLDDG